MSTDLQIISVYALVYVQQQNFDDLKSDVLISLRQFLKLFKQKQF